MEHFFKKHVVFSIILAVVSALFSIWTLGIRLIAMSADGLSDTFRQTESILSTFIFHLLPLTIFLCAALDCRENARTAMFAAAAAKLLSLVAYTVSNAASAQLAQIFTFSLGAAILELSAYILIAIDLRSQKELCVVSSLAAVFGAVYHSICLVELYASMKLVGSGSVVQWLRILAGASTAEFFAAIIKGSMCALVFILIYDECKTNRNMKQKTEKNKEMPNEKTEH